MVWDQIKQRKTVYRVWWIDNYNALLLCLWAQSMQSNHPLWSLSSTIDMLSALNSTRKRFSPFFLPWEQIITLIPAIKADSIDRQKRPWFTEITRDWRFFMSNLIPFTALYVSIYSDDIFCFRDTRFTIISMSGALLLLILFQCTRLCNWHNTLRTISKACQ